MSFWVSDAVKYPQMAGGRNSPDSAAYGQAAASKSRMGMISLESRTVSGVARV
jgi:hypothetical protein